MANLKEDLLAQPPTHPIEPIYGREIEMRSGWKYKSLKFGPLTLPWYASPESQLILVSFVCFLCPGKAVPRNTVSPVTNYIQECLMLSTDLVARVSSTQMPMPVTLRIVRYMQLSLSSASSPEQSSTRSELDSHCRSEALDTVSTLVRIYVSTTLATLVTLSSLVCCSDVVQVSSGPHRELL
jgi:hypothetical protein